MFLNVEEDYWKIFPQQKVFSDFSEKTSQTMWALFLLYNPTKINPLSTMLNLSERKEEIEKTLFKKKVKDKLWQELESLKETYVSKILQTRAKKELVFYYDVLEERRKYIQSMINAGYGESADTIEKLLKSTRSLWEEFDVIKTMVEKEDAAQSHVHGGRKESLTEQQLI